MCVCADRGRGGGGVGCRIREKARPRMFTGLESDQEKNAQLAEMNKFRGIQVSVRFCMCLSWWQSIKRLGKCMKR